MNAATSPDHLRHHDVAAPIDELLAETERTRVVRRRFPDGSSVILKHLRGADANLRWRHETELLQRLAQIPGVARLASIREAGVVLALLDDGGVPLAKRLQSGPLPIDTLLSVAQQLSQTLAGLHGCGVLHKDITPANILLAQPGDRAVLIDFHIATTFTEERPAFQHETQINGTLAYMAPEQTGRTGRSIDQRSDLYALGATLYEIATGQTPFHGSDLLATLHQHLVTVPRAPMVLRPELPRGLSDIILRLLEKEPDRRYQSAEGLAHDLTRVAQLHAQGDSTEFTLGAHDFPRKLAPPSRLIGRQTEQTALRQAFDAAAHDTGQVVLICGSPGVGKSALINELRPWVTTARGWYVVGKYDQFSHDTADGAVVQALRQLGRLLLAEPEDALQRLRAQLLDRLGGNAAMMALTLPEFARVLDVEPNMSVEDPVRAGARLRQGTIDLIRALASPSRPLVLVIDDLQWAPGSSAELIEALHADLPPGLLLVAAYRRNEVEANPPVGALLARWASGAPNVTQMQLANLPPSSVSELLQEMLRLPRAEASRLAQAVGMRTAGNPYDTVELINALRRDGALTLTATGWQWDAQSIRQFVGQGEVLDLLGARIARLPKLTRTMLEILATLGGEVRMRTLSVASGLDPVDADVTLRPALEDGLIQREAQAHDAGSAPVRFRHDRIQQVAYQRIDTAYLPVLHLTLARRLAADTDTHTIAAQQYMLALGAEQAIDGENTRLDSHEGIMVVGLLRDMARRSRVVNYAAVERYLGVALHLFEQTDNGLDPAHRHAQWIELVTERHASLYALGRHAEADLVYERLVASDPAPDLLVAATQVQIQSMVSRLQARKALALGLGLLAQLGLERPTNLDTQLANGLGELRDWACSLGADSPGAQPDIADPATLRLATMVRSTQLAAFLCDHTTHTWLVLQGLRIWREHGPSASLIAGLCSTPLLLASDIKLARPSYNVMRHLLRIGDARGHEPGTSWARHLFTVTSAPWFEPVDECIAHTLRARAGLLQGGDLQGASFTYFQGAMFQLDTGQTLDSYAEENETGAAFEARNGSNILTQAWATGKQFVRAMAGKTRSPGSFSEGELDEGKLLIQSRSPTLGNSNFHSMRGLSAALFDDMASAREHAAAAMKILNIIPAFYAQLHIHLVHAMGQADLLRGLPAGDEAHTAALAQLDAALAWMTERARHAPSNFLHLQHLLEAERAWALGEPWAATNAYQQAISAVPPRGRPWQHAYITERAALFHLANGLDATGAMLMAEARALYDAWGARGKVHQLTQRHAFLRNHARTGPSGPGSGRQTSLLSTDSVDMLAILRASQLLSSETRLDQLTERVSRLLGEMTGAARVQLIVRGDNDAWFLASTEAPGPGSAPLSVEEAGSRGLLPLSAFRYAERLRENVLVPDAKRDDRFSHDPYIAPLAHCSLLLVPIVRNKALRAVLLLENSLSRNAFSDDRLDTVSLVAGQLAVSLENTLLYESLERKVQARTEALAEANRQLEALSITDALTSLPNRRRFNDVIDMEFKRAMRSASPIGLTMIDIDQFKLYNDQQGHQAGDACLRQVAQLLKSGLRRGTDFIGRYGGEEFVVVLPGTDLPGTQVVAERLRECVASAQSPHAHSLHGFVSVSIGCTAFVPDPARSWADHLELADQALYLAKHEGRNRVKSLTHPVAHPGAD